MKTTSTWRTEIGVEMHDQNESWASVVASTLSDEELDCEFDLGYGSTKGAPFTLWTTNRVYFPWCYDGAEGVASVPRNPDGTKTSHVGG